MGVNGENKFFFFKKKYHQFISTKRVQPVYKISMQADIYKIPKIFTRIKRMSLNKKISDLESNIFGFIKIQLNILKTLIFFSFQIS